MPVTVEELNEWLEQRAVEANSEGTALYYRSYKDIDKQPKVTISTIEMIGDWCEPPRESKLWDYMKDHMAEYSTEGFTGFGIFTRLDHRDTN